MHIDCLAKRYCDNIRDLILSYDLSKHTSLFANREGLDQHTKVTTGFGLYCLYMRVNYLYLEKSKLL